MIIISQSSFRSAAMAAPAPTMTVFQFFGTYTTTTTAIRRVQTRFSSSCSRLAFQNNNIMNHNNNNNYYYFDKKRQQEPKNILRKKNTSVLFFSTSVGMNNDKDTTTTTTTTTTNKKIPVILLAGFLGSGKTSTLQYLLTNTSSTNHSRKNKKNNKQVDDENNTIKIGVVVNDMASVNIDAKLLSSSSPNNNNNNNHTMDPSSLTATTTDTNDDEDDDTVELQNGCACCSLAEELFTSILRLTKNGTRRHRLDAIVVELSGISDPMTIKENWEQATLLGHPATNLATMERIVTLIDATTFGTDWMTWDTAGDRPLWMEEEGGGGSSSSSTTTTSMDHHAAARKIPELLAEQVEAANLLLINKIDLAGKVQTSIVTRMVRELNDRAIVREVEYGRVDVEELLGIRNDNAMMMMEKEEECSHHNHPHAQHDDENNDPLECTVARSGNDPSHSHSQQHHHDGYATSASCSEPTRTTSLSQSQRHDDDKHLSLTGCMNPDCTDQSHSHAHEHDSTPAAGSSSSRSTSAENLGITSFVYRASVPFHSQRLLELLNRWPVPGKDTLDLEDCIVKTTNSPDNNSINNMINNNNNIIEQAFIGVLRSKGFCWMAPSNWTPGKAGSGGDVWRHDTAMYWSHAGRHFGISSAGKWWGSLRKEQIKTYFAGNMKEYDRIMREDWVSEEWGDRRQELVFIGANIDEHDIRAALDKCLCTEEEMESYRFQLRNCMASTFSTARDGPSLFNVGTVDHMDSPGN